MHAGIDADIVIKVHSLAITHPECEGTEALAWCAPLPPAHAWNVYCCTRLSAPRSRCLSLLDDPALYLSAMLLLLLQLLLGLPKAAPLSPLLGALRPFPRGWLDP